MFWWIFGTVLVTIAADGYNDFEDLESLDDDYLDYYKKYYNGEASYATNKKEEFINRVRRYQQTLPKTLSPDEVQEVKGALSQLLSGMGVESHFTPYTTETNDYTPSIETSSITPTYTDSESSSTIDITTIDSTFPTRTPKHPATKFLYDLRDNFVRLRPLLEFKKYNNNLRNTATTLNTTEDLNITTITPTTTKTRQLDIPRLLEIIADLASEFETNLTRKLNETLIQMSIPTCTTPTTEPPVTSEYDSNYTGATIAKCFVCGLDIPGIPENSHCADAFAGDFLPLVPVDPTSKSMISKFRKYCKYSNEPGYRLNSTQPRSIYGRWTGGCSVRWIDLSGTYTQRSCRNRMFPTIGKHYASKRMAKLEKTLWKEEDGCVVSPMATLVPLSRGVSLYARFHACVCTGNWCNTSSHNTQWIWKFIILFFSGLLYFVIPAGYMENAIFMVSTDY